MNNTEKLLRAFIEASGYEIEEVKNFQFTNYKVTKKPLGHCGIDDWRDLTNQEKIMVIEQQLKKLKLL